MNKKKLINEILSIYEYEYPTASGAFDEFVTKIIPNIINNYKDEYDWHDLIKNPNDLPDLENVLIYNGENYGVAWKFNVEDGVIWKTFDESLMNSDQDARANNVIAWKYIEEK